MPEALPTRASGAARDQSFLYAAARSRDGFDEHVLGGEGAPIAPPAVTIVVPTFRREAALRTTLQALDEQRFPGDQYEVIVVDDDSEGSAAPVAEQMTRSSRAPMRYVNEGNAGVATARNRGAAAAKGDVLIFVDDDMIVEPDHIERHLAARGEDSDCLVNGHWEFSPDVRSALAATPFGRFRIEVEEWVKDGIEKVPLDDVRTMPAQVTACNLSIGRALFQRLGGFDETFPFAGFEDQELSHRAERAGCRFIYDPTIRLQHNDNRLTLKQFCERQRRGALTAVHMASKHPAEYASRPLIVENAPISRHDPLGMIVKKAAKRVLSSPAMLTLDHAAIGLLERAGAGDRLLRRLYWAMCGLYIYRGVREGLVASPLGDAATPR